MYIINYIKLSYCYIKLWSIHNIIYVTESAYGQQMLGSSGLIKVSDLSNSCVASVLRYKSSYHQVAIKSSQDVEIIVINLESSRVASELQPNLHLRYCNIATCSGGESSWPWTCWLCFNHPVAYVCSQNTTSHDAEKLICHCLLPVLPPRPSSVQNTILLQ